MPKHKSKNLWNPRYTAYAKEHARTEEEMLAHDRIAWPGGHMTGFTIWIRAKWIEWSIRQRKQGHKGDLTMLFDEEHASFDAMLVE